MNKKITFHSLKAPEGLYQTEMRNYMDQEGQIMMSVEPSKTADMIMYFLEDAYGKHGDNIRLELKLLPQIMERLEVMLDTVNKNNKQVRFTKGK